MREKVENAFGHRLDVFGKSVPTLLVAALFIVGTGSAAVTTLVSPTSTGDLTVDQGLELQLTNAPSTIDGNSFTFGTNAGSSFTYEYEKENLANDNTQALVEVTTLDAASSDVEVKTLEKVNFYAKQTTTETEGSTVPEGTDVDLTLTVDSQGNIDESANGDYLFMNSVDTDDDNNLEGVICIANPALSGEGLTFGPGEHWDADMTIDTQTSFTDDDVEVSTSLHTVYNPSTGSYSDAAANCPQYTP